jgi:Family of unknown function (DUF6154)
MEGQMIKLHKLERGKNMKIVDDLYNYYYDKLTGDEEDAEIIAFSILEDLNKNEIFQWIDEMEEEELKFMVGSFIAEQLKEKMAKEGVGQTRIGNDHDIPNIH